MKQNKLSKNIELDRLRYKNEQLLNFVKEFQKSFGSGNDLTSDQIKVLLGMADYIADMCEDK